MLTRVTVTDQVMHAHRRLTLHVCVCVVCACACQVRNPESAALPADGRG
jgi:hypothetical protein